MHSYACSRACISPNTGTFKHTRSHKPTPPSKRRYVTANLLLWRDPSLQALSLASSSSSNAIGSAFFESPAGYALSGGSLTSVPRTLAVTNSFSATFGVTSPVTVTLSAAVKYEITLHTNAVASRRGADTWANQQKFNTAFSLKREGASLHDIQSSYAWGARGPVSARVFECLAVASVVQRLAAACSKHMVGTV